MAKVMTYTNSYGEDYPDSYWNVAQVNLCKAEKTGMVLFHGYRDEASKGRRIIGTKQYSVSPDQYDTYFAPLVIDPEGVNHVRQAYEFAASVLDTDGASFFAEAIDA